MGLLFIFFRSNQQVMSISDNWYVRSTLLLLLLLAIVVVYKPGLNGPFVLDDATNIPQTSIDQLTLESITRVATDNTSGIFGRPIPVATFALNHYFGDGTPYAFKLTNVVIHIFNTILVFILAQLLLKIASKEFRLTPQSKIFASALLISALWALHPYQVSTVLYSVQRMTMLMTSFSILAIICYLNARIEYGKNNQYFIFYTVSTLVFAILACLSKENGVLTILYIGIAELLIRKDKSYFNKTKTENRLSIGFLTLIGLGISAGLAYFALNIDSLLSSYTIRDFTLSQRLATEGSVLVQYLKNILMPNISNMNLYWDDFSIISFSSATFLKSISILLVLIVIAIMLRNTIPLFTFGIFFYFLSHTLESTFIPLEIAFEHRNYIGTIGIALAVVSIFYHYLKKVDFKTIGSSCAFLALALLSFQTYSRSVEWSDDLVLNSLAVENNPNSERAKLSLAISLLSRSKLTEAVHLFESASRENTYDAHTHLHLIQFKAYGGVFNQDEFENTLELVKTRPVTNDVVRILDDMLTNVTNGIYHSPNFMQMSQLFQAATDNPEKRIHDNNHAVLYARYSASLSLQKQYKGALTALEFANKLNSRNPEIIIMMAEALEALGRQSQISGVISRIPTDILITDEQRTRIKRLELIDGSHEGNYLDLTQSPDEY